MWLTGVESISLIIASHLIFFISFFGIGMLLRRYLPGSFSRGKDVFRSFWLGWAATLGSLQIWHFFLPVDWRASIIVVLIGVVSFLYFCKMSFSGFAGGFNRTGVLKLVLFAVVILWWSDLALEKPLIADSRGYHLYAVRWYSEYPVVPGFANLHRRAGGFNNSYFLNVALMDVGPFRFGSHHLASGFLMCALLGQLLFGGNFSRSRQLRLMLIPPLLSLTWMKFQSSPVTDLPAIILACVLLIEMFDSFVCMSRRRRKFSFLYILIVACAGVACKLSFAVFAFGCVLLALYNVLSRGYKAERLHMFAVGVACCATIIVPWILRGVIQSGYAVYPLVATGVPVEWRLPEKIVREEANWIKSWARMPGVEPEKVLGDWSWLRHWFSELVRERVMFVQSIYPLLLGAVALGALLVIALRYKSGSAFKREKRGLLLLLPPLAGVAFWFFTAPDPRFAIGVFWAFSALCIMLTLLVIGRLGKNKFALALCLALVLHSAPMIYYARRFSIPMVKPYRESGFYPTPYPECKPFTTDSGLELYVPQQGYNIWYGNLLSTPFPDRKLRLRKKGDLAGGFVLDTGVSD